MFEIYWSFFEDSLDVSFYSITLKIFFNNSFGVSRKLLYDWFSLNFYYVIFILAFHQRFWEIFSDVSLAFLCEIFFGISLGDSLRFSPLLLTFHWNCFAIFFEILFWCFIEGALRFFLTFLLAFCLVIFFEAFWRFTQICGRFYFWSASLF